MPLSLLAFVALVPQSLSIVPTDDIWAYPHAGDPGKDGYLRVWGREGDAVAKLPADATEFSYSLLKFDLSGLPTGKKVTKAQLVLTAVAGPNYSEAQAQKYPLQARPVGTEFTEKTWKYDQLNKAYPSFEPKSVFGAGYPKPFPKPEEEGIITIDLLQGPGEFAKAFEAAQSAGKPFGIALTSTLDITLNDQVQTIYKLYSKDAPVEKLRPKLVLTFG